MATINSGAIALCSLAEVTITCDFCGEEFGGYDEPIDIAEAAHEEGWRADKHDVVRCPGCKGKRKKKAQ